MDIKKRIKDKLNEWSFNYRENQIDFLNLKHVGKGIYKNPKGEKFEWDQLEHKFIRVK